MYLEFDSLTLTVTLLKRNEITLRLPAILNNMLAVNIQLGS